MISLKVTVETTSEGFDNCASGVLCGWEWEQSLLPERECRCLQVGGREAQAGLSLVRGARTVCLLPGDFLKSEEPL